MKATDPYSPRLFLPETVDLTRIEELEPLINSLEQKLSQCKTASDLEKWLNDVGEFSAALDEVHSRRHIAMTCQTDDPEREKAYLHMVEVVDPWMKPKHFNLWKKLTEHPAFESLPEYHRVFARSVRNEVSLYREANVPRETEIAKLSQEYQKTIGAMTVEFDGKEQTLAQLGRIQEETDRTRRQAAWAASANRRLEDAATLDKIFDQMLDYRSKIAHEAGFDNYRDYAFQSRERFDYTAQDCLTFHEAIERTVLPVVREIQEHRRKTLGVNQLKPWDLAVDPLSRPPLKPFQTGAELLDKGITVFDKLDPRLGSMLRILRDQEMVDLDNRKGKAPGGYQATLAESRLPFIFMNAVGVSRDVETLLHEAGHAFHTLASREQPLYWYRNAPIEFCEVASMTMELLAAPHQSEFYSTEELSRARRDHLEGIIKFFPWMATVDAFQHWIYTHEGHSAADRHDAWLNIAKRFSGIEDWSGYEAVRRHLWHRQLHIFEYPFYYVEYGIAQLGALQLWRLSQQGVKQAVDAYLNGLKVGGSRPLPQLFSAASIRFDFTEQTLQPLMQLVRENLAQLS